MAFQPLLKQQVDGVIGLLALSLVTHFRFEILRLSYFQLCIFSVYCNHIVDLNV